MSLCCVDLSPPASNNSSRVPRARVVHAVAGAEVDLHFRNTVGEIPVFPGIALNQAINPHQDPRSIRPILQCVKPLAVLLGLLNAHAQSVADRLLSSSVSVWRARPCPSATDQARSLPGPSKRPAVTSRRQVRYRADCGVASEGRLWPDSDLSPFGAFDPQLPLATTTWASVMQRNPTPMNVRFTAADLSPMRGQVGKHIAHQARRRLRHAIRAARGIQDIRHWIPYQDGRRHFGRRPSGGATRPTRQIRRPRSPCSTADAGVTPTLCQRLAGAARHAARRLADDPGSR